METIGQSVGGHPGADSGPVIQSKKVKGRLVSECPDVCRYQKETRKNDTGEYK
jgi:hypothetical protein